MNRLAIALMLAMASTAAASDYVKSGAYYWKDGKPYTIVNCAPYRAKYRCGNRWCYKTCTRKYVPVEVDPKKHDTIESLWQMGLTITKERQRYYFNERKKAIHQQYAIEMARELDLPIKMEGSVPNIGYGFGQQHSQFSQGATSALGYPLTLASTSSTKTTSYWNPDNRALLINKYSNAVERQLDSSDVAVSGLGSLAQQEITGSERLEAQRLQSIERLERITRETQRMMAALEHSKTSYVEEETTTTTTEQRPTPAPTPIPPNQGAGPRRGIISTRCAVCHGGNNPSGNFDLSAETLAGDVVKKARWAVRRGMGKASEENLQLLGFTSQEQDGSGKRNENYLPAMPVDSAHSLVPLTESEYEEFDLELEQRLQQ